MYVGDLTVIVLGTLLDSPCRTYPLVLLDTKGPEIRTGFFKEGIDKIELTKGQELILTGDYTYKGDSTKLACSYETIASSVRPGQQILVADGSLVLTVLTCDEPNREVTCRIENNVALGERKNMVRGQLPAVVFCRHSNTTVLSHPTLPFRY